MKHRQALQELSLPIFDVLDGLLTTLSDRTAAVLIAPPGAGKTTVVPLALLDAAWLNRKKILVVVPRRLAARSAAERMASLLGEAVGETVGMRARLASRIGPRTRIEVVTEGVFSRIVIDDPELSGIGLVIFDEFHERSLEADFGLALCCDVQDGLRDDLRLLVMSATLDGGQISAVLNDAPVLESQGRMFPVKTFYTGVDRRGRIEPQVCDVVENAMQQDSGSCLVFLPGQGEIRRVLSMLQERLVDETVDILPLYGGMSPEAQHAAIRPSPDEKRKIVLATAIAETSITIDGVRIVVDAGLARVARYDAGARLTRLETVRVSRASADQRRGRAGRTEPGVCYRLWSEPEIQGLRPFELPEIQSADLTDVVLNCAAWGVSDLGQLRWIEPPPVGAVASARQQLVDMGALDSAGRMTVQGGQLRTLPLPPHLGRMLLFGALCGQAPVAADLCALLVERGVGGASTDLDLRLAQFRSDRGQRGRQVRELARQWVRSAERLCVDGDDQPPHPMSGGLSSALLLMVAYPDRIAKRRGARGQFLLSNGRAAYLDESDPLAAEDYLVVADLQGAAARARILAAVSLAEEELFEAASERIQDTVEIAFDSKAKAVRADKVRRLDAIALSRETLAVPRDDVTAAELARGIVEEFGLEGLPWSRAQEQLLARLRFVGASDMDVGSDWPDVSDQTLRHSHKTWLAPFLVGKIAAKEVTANDLAAALDGMLHYHQRQKLDNEAPAFFNAPTGNRHPIDYSGELAPSVSLRVQELYGLTEHPAVAGGRRPLTLSLLSPAGRPIQVTQNLPGFWAGSWHDVKTEMKGRYPKHVWPDDPARADPTTRTKARGGASRGS